MNKLFGFAAAGLIAIAPLAATADESVLRLDSTKSTGNRNAAVGDELVLPAEEVLVGGGLSTAGAIALGVGGLLLLGAIASSDSSDGTEDHDSDDDS